MYLFLLIISFGISMALFPVAKWVAYRYDVMAIPDSGNIHSKPTPSTGGMMLCLTLLLSVLFIPVLLSAPSVPISYIAWWQYIGIFFIFIVGFFDDKFNIKYSIRLFLQIIISLFFVIASGLYLTDFGLPMLTGLPAVAAIPFTVFCIVGVINAYNIIDGVDGLCAGCGLIFFALIAFMAYMYNDQAMLLAAFLFAGCLLGFIIFNFPSAKIFMGDGGSYLIGFSVAMMAIIILKRNPDISTWTLLLITFMPVFDAVFAISRRIHKKKSPFKADQNHMHHVLRRRYGSDTKAVIVMWSLQILIGVTAILFQKYTSDRYTLSYVLIAVTLLSIVFLRRLWHKKMNIAGIRI